MWDILILKYYLLFTRSSHFTGHAEILFAKSSNPAPGDTDNVWRQSKGSAMGISWVEAMGVAKYHTMDRTDAHSKTDLVHNANRVKTEKHFNWLNTASNEELSSMKFTLESKLKKP